MEISSWEDEPTAGYESMRQGRSAVAAGRYGRVPAGQGATASSRARRQGVGSTTAGRDGWQQGDTARHRLGRG